MPGRHDEFPEVRNLDDIYIRVPTASGSEARCLTDCPWSVVQAWIEEHTTDGLDRTCFLLRTAEHLHGQLRSIGDTFRLSRVPEED